MRGGGGTRAARIYSCGCRLPAAGLREGKVGDGGDADPAWATAGGLGRVPRARPSSAPGAPRVHVTGPPRRIRVGLTLVTPFGVSFLPSTTKRSALVTLVVIVQVRPALQPRFLWSWWAETGALFVLRGFLLQVFVLNRTFLTCEYEISMKILAGKICLVKKMPCLILFRWSSLAIG